jgi:hypothetical protein
MHKLRTGTLSRTVRAGTCFSSLVMTQELAITFNVNSSIHIVHDVKEGPLNVRS